MGHFVGCWEVDGFRDYNDFTANMDLWIDRFENTNTPEGATLPVIIPGTPERLAFEERKSTGIPLVDAVYQDLHQIRTQLQLSQKFE